MKLLMAREYYCSEELFVHITLEFPSFIFFHHTPCLFFIRRNLTNDKYQESWKIEKVKKEHYNTLHKE